MALEAIVEKEQESNPVMVDIPVEVATHVTPKPAEHKRKSIIDLVPRKWFITAIGVLVFILLVGIYLLIKYFIDRPDLVLKAPTAKPVVTATPSADLVASISGNLASVPYINSDEGYLITPPDGWVIDESGKTSASVVFLSPTPKTINGRGFATSISVEQSPAEGIELLKQVETIKKGLTKAFPDFVTEDDIQVYIQGRPFYLLGGTYSVDGIYLRKRTLIGIYKNRGYAVSASGPVVNWPDYESVMSASMFSFRLL